MATSTSSLLKFARTGGVGERLVRGFVIGVGIGLFMAIVLCCWILRMRLTRMQQQMDHGERRERNPDSWAYAAPEIMLQFQYYG